jgi:hypothetical protein
MLSQLLWMVEPDMVMMLDWFQQNSLFVQSNISLSLAEFNPVTSAVLKWLRFNSSLQHSALYFLYTLTLIPLSVIYNE